MSRHIEQFFGRERNFSDFLAKMKKTLTPGRRIIPPQTAKHDQENQLRIDAGENIDGKQKVVLQVNSQATNQGLLDWMKKQPQKTHAKLATAYFDTHAKDTRSEAERVFQELESDAKSKVG